MPAIARVAVDISLDREFDYLIPEGMEVSIGNRVILPFGRRKASGYVVDILERSDHDKLKPITKIEPGSVRISENILNLARWMAGYYCSSLEQALRTVLPGAVRKKGAGHKKQLFTKLTETGMDLPAEVEKRLSEKQASVISTLKDSEGMFLTDLTAGLEITAAPVRALEKKGILTIEEQTRHRDPYANRKVIPTLPLELMDEQATALEQINESITRQEENPDASPLPLLLHGVTGSGKTEVYLQAIAGIIKNGGSAIVLVPEISLTPQTVERFRARFGNSIAVLHSHLSEGERHDEWHRINSGEANIVIGARSAVFAPAKNLKLIVVDEEHEHSYKQEDAPRYNARDIAVMRGHFDKCTVVLGTATPSLESWQNARTGKYILSKLTKRVDDRKMPLMHIVDMRIEAERTGHVSVFSRDLINAMQNRIDRAEQTILFLNRRGFSTSLICTKCGYVASCDHCSVSYTYHQNDAKLRCHICGDSRVVPDKCPSCQDPQFKYSGIGTQRIESIVKKFFPHAKVARMDTDTTTTKHSYDEILGAFRRGKTDILIGTQMIAKGLHFPNVTLVGIVHADLSLHMPDFRASERTFQLLAQVAGRAGRGEIAGEVIVQTYTPHNPAVQAARRIDFEGFADQELEFRKELQYPPFSRLTCITVRGRSEEKVSFSAATIAGRLRKEFGESSIVSEASPAPLARAKGLFRYQVIVRAASAVRTATHIKRILADLNMPKGVRASTDIDALSIL